ncbi:ATP cone domain-containing protein [Caloramator sp. CAR-1]|jgi:transcriptional repressor NrdR|uniref:ATP cone domain-containing protein n=1 Tax=Caloramator sp. CAR-1 TaxID=3062777 RepID=UPI0026E30A62|nr:ATP cone domain-containing protein [Caloramator sp. CAR-1]MDO6354332.1 ATP cone domain-containing protein [Caloramator sp. CAR-1]
MKVIKKDGRVEEFYKDKIITSIENASDDVKEPLTMSDVENVVREVEKNLLNLNKKEVTTHEIRQVTIEVLKNFGFNDVAEAYENFI